MTSAVSRDDVEDQLWRHVRPGTSPAVIRSLLKTIDQYAIFAARKYTVDDDLPPVVITPDPYEHILPGQFDMELGMGRCLRCEIPKSIHEFTKNSASKTGRRPECRLCRKQGGWREIRPRKRQCVVCGKRKEVSNFLGSKCLDCVDQMKTCLCCYERQSADEFPLHPDRRDLCRTCRKTRRADIAILLSQYLCRACGERKWVEEFPAGKRLYPQRNFACKKCEGKPQASRHTKENDGLYLCRSCNKRHDINDFPPIKKTNPSIMVSCKYCAHPSQLVS